jgi:hypothetical protein
VLGLAALDRLVGLHLGVVDDVAGTGPGVLGHRLRLGGRGRPDLFGLLVGVVQQAVPAGDDLAGLVDLGRQHLAQLVQQVEHPLARQHAGRRHGHRPCGLDLLDQLGQQLVRATQGLVGHQAPRCGVAPPGLP